MPAIRSSAITFAEYDADKQELVLTFEKGNSYTYYGISANIYEDFINSESRGKFFNKYIRDKFPER